MKYKRFISALVVTSIFAIPLISCSSSNDSSDKEGNSTLTSKPTTEEDKRIKISTVDDFLAISSKGDYVLVNDIDFNGVKEYLPISKFTGNLDGANHKITNFNFEFTSYTNAGLFNVLSGTVSNLEVSGNLVGKNKCEKMGMICGTNDGVISNVTVSGKVVAPNSIDVGGICGANTVNGRIKESINKADIEGKEDAGGIAGRLTLEKRSKPYNFASLTNEGKIIGETSVGGIFGKINSSNGNYEVNIDGFTNKGNVKGVKFVGGIVGSSTSYATVYTTNALNEANIEGENYVGGIFGYNYNGTMKDSVSKGRFIATNLYVGSYLGMGEKVYLEGLTSIATNYVKGRAYVGGIAGSTYSISKCVNECLVVAEKGYYDEVLYACVGGVAGRASIIDSCENNMPISIDFKGENVGGITGMLATISNTVCSNNVNRGVINSKGNNVGGIVGRVTITDYMIKYTCADGNINYADVTSEGDSIGGIFGKIFRNEHYSYDVINNENRGKITGRSKVGGIIGDGYSLKTMDNCINKGDVKGSEEYVGGYVGIAYNSTLKNLVNEVTVEGKAYVGGIAGEAGSVESCVNKGKIISNGTVIRADLAVSNTGGVVGYCKTVNHSKNYGEITVNSSGLYVGGVAGHLVYEYDRIEGNENYVDITLESNSYVGGIFGYIDIEYNELKDITVVLVDNKNEGAITSLKGEYVGGLVGRFKSYHTSVACDLYLKVINNENTGKITGTRYVGGLIGCCNKIKNTTEDWATNISSGEVVAESNFSKYIGALL